MLFFSSRVATRQPFFEHPKFHRKGGYSLLSCPATGLQRLRRTLHLRRRPAIVAQPAATLKRVVSPKQADDPVLPAEFTTHGLSERFRCTVYHNKTLDPSVTRQTFLRWRSPQLCTDNPTDVTNPYYIAMIKAGWCGYSVSKHFMGDRFAIGAGPVWCFSRYGRSRTVLDRPVSSLGGTILEAGTKIFIAGEHEDSSDPDFYIYNDVTIVRPNGDIKVYQYPWHVFPPTDGHSATLIGNEVWIIGSVGYQGARGDKAQVCVLDLTTMEMSGKVTIGDDPGWIADHTVIRVEADEIEVHYGPPGRARSTVQPGSWIFHMRELRWERGTQQKLVPEDTSMDEASFRGLPEILDFWKAKGMPCVYGTQGWCQYERVLDWWKSSSGLTCKWKRRQPERSSGGAGVVEAQWADFSIQQLEQHWASSNGCIAVLDWWRTSRLPLKMDYPVDEASKQGNLAVLEWFKNSGDPFSMDQPVQDWATGFGYVEVLEWWKNSGLPCKWSRDWLRRWPSGLRIDPAKNAAVKKWWTENRRDLELKWGKVVHDARGR